jgi:mycothiol synthase
MARVALDGAEPSGLCSELGCVVQASDWKRREQEALVAAKKAKRPEQPVTITSAVSLTPEQTVEAEALKRECDAADGLDLKLTWGGLSESAQVFMARSGEQLVGYCSLDGDETVAELCGMVAPAWRRHGVGMRLFEAARLSFRDGGGEQLYAICEDASAPGRAFIARFPAQRSFSEHRMELHAATLPADDGTLEIRQLRPGDGEAITAYARITAAAFERPLEQTLRHIPSDLSQPAESLYLALAAGEPVGGFKLYREEATTGIYGFAVDPERQRQGLGRRMLAQACALAREQGAARVTLEVETTNERAIALYSSSGFETTTTYGYYLFSRSMIVAGLDGVTTLEAHEIEQ